MNHLGMDSGPASGRCSADTQSHPIETVVEKRGVFILVVGTGFFNSMYINFALQRIMYMTVVDLLYRHYAGH
jgi:hypothetical protein